MQCWKKSIVLDVRGKSAILELWFVRTYRQCRGLLFSYTRAFFFNIIVRIDTIEMAVEITPCNQPS